MNKIFYVAAIICVVLISSLYTQNSYALSFPIQDEVRIISERHIDEDHQMMILFKHSEGYRDYNSKMFGDLDLQNCILYKFDDEGKRAISLPILTTNENAGRVLIACFDLHEQKQITRVVEIIAEPSDDDGNYENPDPERFSGRVQLLDQTGELLYGRTFEEGTVISNYGSYVMSPCQSAAIGMFTGSVLGGLIGGFPGLLGGYLNGLVGVIMSCCCD